MLALIKKQYLTNYVINKTLQRWLCFGDEIVLAKIVLALDTKASI